MKTKLIAFALIACSLGSFAQKGMKVSLTNKEAVSFDDYMVKLPLAKVKAKLPAFDEASFVAVDGTSEIALQVATYQNERYVVFPVAIPAKGGKQVEIRKASSSFSYPKRTYAEITLKQGGKFVNRKYQGGTWVKTNAIRVPDEHTDHSFDIKYEGPGWESDKVAYRFYLDWRNATDLFGKRTSDMVLQNVGVDSFDSYHELSSWGMDILKVGPSLGVGTIAYWDGEKAQRVAKTDSVYSKVAVDGRVQSRVETTYYGWDIAGGKHLLRSSISIDAGSRASRQELQIDGTIGNLCTGIIKDAKAELIVSKGSAKGWGYIATWGKQSLNKDNMGLAVLFRSADLITVTSDKDNHVVVLKPKKGVVDYYFLGAWELEPNGIKSKDEFTAYLNKLAAQLSEPVATRVL